MADDAALRRFVRSLRYDARNILFALRHCRRPLSVVGAIQRRERVPRVTLRDGTTIAAPEMRTLLWLLEEIFIDRAYEHESVQVRRGDIVVDIGAHVGMFAVYALQRGASRVVTCEPLPSNVRLLRENIERNGFAGDRVTVVEAAVADREGEATLGVGRMSVGNVLSDVAPNEPTSDLVRVRTTTLAALMRDNGIDRIDYLKVDCEGSEGVMLDAASDDELMRIDRIALEYHDDWSSLDSGAIARRLQSAGFSIAVAPRVGTANGVIYAAR